MNRRWELDLLRGIMLVMMFITHLPTQFSSLFGQPFGYVSAAEGFVMLSAFMAGMIYTRRAQKAGIPAMRRAFFQRAMTVYACHAFLLLVVFFVIGAIGVSREQSAVTDLLSFYLSHPQAALPGSLLLIYNPPLLDILPLYILLLFVSPFVLAHGMKKGWTAIFACSGMLWLGAQFGMSKWLFQGLVSATNLQVPYTETGSFETFAWQFLWVFGLWLGAMTAQGLLRDRRSFPKQLVAAAAMTVAACLIWRHVAGQVPVPGGDGALINQLFDKWHLGPLRMANLFGMLILVMHYGDRITRFLPRIGYLEKLGAASLPVFCAHLAVVFLALTIAGQPTPERPASADLLLLGGGLAVLYVTALITLRFDQDEQETPHPILAKAPIAKTPPASQGGPVN